MQNLFSTVDRETSTPIDAQITGEVPSWLNGSLYRNGPGKFEFGDTKYNHWFDGSALLHRFHIQNGTVSYSNRFLRSDTYCKNEKANRIVVTEFGTMSYPDPCKSMFQRVFSWFEKKEASDNTLINFYPIGESLFTATETNFLRRVDPATLETLDKVDLQKIVCIHGATAHPHFDQDGSYHNLGAVYGIATKYTIVKLTPPVAGNQGICEKAEVVGQVEAQWKAAPCYFHSFGMSENYYILIEQPLCINLLKLASAYLRGSPFADVMEYRAKYPVKFHIIDKKTGRKINADLDYTADPFVVIHHINAYEEQDHLIVDVCSFEDGNVFQGYMLKSLQSGDADEYLAGLPRPRVRRYVLPLWQPDIKELGNDLVKLKNANATAVLKGKQNIFCHPQIIGDKYLEFPQINYKHYNGRKYHFAFGCGYQNTQLDSLVKLNVETGRTLVWEENCCFPSEPVFVARPGAVDEDDGLLLSVILTTDDKRHPFLLILNAKDFQEVARATINVKIGRDMHGTFLSYQDFPAQTSLK